MRRIALLSSLAVLAFAWGCGSVNGGTTDGGSDAPTDGRTKEDGSTRKDAGQDGGAVKDGGEEDGGTMNDGGEEDGGMMTDGGTDGGMMADGGTDGGAMTDGGTDLCEGVDCSGMDTACTVGVCNPMTGMCTTANKANNTACDDGFYCTDSDKCTDGTCGGTMRNCSDGKSCTTDTCNETTDSCESTLLPNRCLIGGACKNANAANPANSCQFCDPAQSTSAYSVRPDTTSCDDGLYCTVSDSCTSGTCGGVARVCDDSLACTTDSCNEASDSCDAPVDAGFCVISNMCIASGTTNSGNQCEVCDPSKSKTAWSPKALNTACDDGQFCTVTDVCDGAGSCGGSVRDCSDGLTCTTDTCNEGSDVCENALIAGNCLITGTCYANAALNPGNDCERCRSTTNPTSWVPRSIGSTCGGVAPSGAVNACDGSSSCEVECAEGQADCNSDLGLGQAGNGCETALGTETNCLACGNACGVGEVCAGAGCVSNLRIFVTSTKYDGAFDSLSDADYQCQLRANAGGLTGVWQAWLSDNSNNPTNRFITHSTVPYKLPNGTQVADDWTDLTDGSIDHAIDVTEYGIAVASPYVAWTGTDENGTVSSQTCTGWSSSSSGVTGVYGLTNTTGNSWSSSSTATCQNVYRLYCVEQ
ncbi:MAG: hypothetical protein R3A78_11405 [Polyangiales bacterium]